MSERPVEDEMMDEARKFSAAMAAAVRRHAQAANWLERRKARRDISLVMRGHRRAEEQARKHQIAWTNQMVDRYRAHALAVETRRFDPLVDRDRRARDAQALAEHAKDLKLRVLANTRLTAVERGIALDAVELANEDPRWRHGGNLFRKAGRVRGVEALRYRAEVARTARELGVDRATGRYLGSGWSRSEMEAERDREAWEASEREARRLNRERYELGRIDAAQPDQDRYQAQLAWIGRDGKATTLTRAFATERTATAWMHREIDHAMWAEGTTVRAQTTDTRARDRGLLYAEKGRPEAVAKHLQARETVLREQVLAGHIHREQPERSPNERGHGGTPRYSSTVTYLPDGANQVVHEHARHGSEIESAVWTHQQVSTIRPAPGTTVHVAAYDNSREGPAEPMFRAVGQQQFAADEVAEWWDHAERRRRAVEEPDRKPEQHRGQVEQPQRGDPPGGEAQRLAEVERRLREISTDRDEMARKVAVLERGLDAVTADRDQIRSTLDAAEGRIEELKNRNTRLSAEVDELRRNQPEIDQLTSERDRYKSERDQAVQKLVARTPVKERLGSAERAAADHSQNTQPVTPRDLPARNGIERSR